MFFDSRFDSVSPKCIRISRGNISSELNIIEVGYNKVPAGKCQIMHRDVFILHYVVSGKGVFQGQPFDKTCAYLVVPGELEIISADENDPYESYWIIFKGTLAPEIIKLCGLEKRCQVFPFDKNAECAEILHSALFDNYANDYAEAFTLQAAFNRLVAIHTNENRVFSGSVNLTARDLAMIFEKNYQQDLKINELAENFHYSRNHLYSIFKSEYGVSPQDYLLNLRIEKAKQLLSREDVKFTVKEVAYAVGFRDQLYFSKLFKKRTGVSPLEFRNERKNRILLRSKMCDMAAAPLTHKREC